MSPHGYSLTHTPVHGSLSHFFPRPLLQPHPVGHPSWVDQMVPGELCVARATPVKASSWAAQKVLQVVRRRQAEAPRPDSTSPSRNFISIYKPPPSTPTTTRSLPQGSLEQVALLSV